MKILSLILVLMIMTSCKKSNSPATTSVSTTNIDNYADTIETSVNGLSGALDDANNETIVAVNKPNIFEMLLEKTLLSNAYAATCSRALSNSSGVCTRNVNCESGAYVWSGVAQLTFSNGTNCSLGAIGETYTRTVDFTRSGPRGSLQTTSASRAPYAGANIGGGIEVTKADNGTAVDINILGQHKILTRSNGTRLFDISTKTLSDLRLNQIARNGRVVQSGAIEVLHNLAQFTANHTITNLTYSSACCYPVSGSISTTLSGSLSGNGSVTFNGCGNFTATLNGQTKSYSLSNCE